MGPPSDLSPLTFQNVLVVRKGRRQTKDSAQLPCIRASRQQPFSESNDGSMSRPRAVALRADDASEEEAY